MTLSAEQMIERLQLEPLSQEGGWFRRIYTGELDANGRAVATSIYALFTREQFSALHRLDADEQFFFLAGDPFEVFQIDQDGAGRTSFLGSAMDEEKRPNCVFAKGTWFGGRPLDGGAFGWSLISAVVIPGFVWEGFELGERETLVERYPDFESEIARFTR